MSKNDPETSSSDVATQVRALAAACAARHVDIPKARAALRRRLKSDAALLAGFTDYLLDIAVGELINAARCAARHKTKFPAADSNLDAQAVALTRASMASEALLEMPTAIGKRVGDCAAEELGVLATQSAARGQGLLRLARWYSSLAAMVPEGQPVREFVNEEAARKLWNESAGGAKDRLPSIEQVPRHAGKPSRRGQHESAAQRAHAAA